jgi:hypothetical protein
VTASYEFATAHSEEFQHVVEDGRVGALAVDDGLDVGETFSRTGE